MKAPEFSIIIPALNEERNIGRCLDGLIRLDFPKSDYEVLLVDNGSTDRTLEIAQSFASKMRLRVWQKLGLRISEMRNWGASKARGTSLAFIDADCVAPSRWLQAAKPLLEGDGIGIVGAHYRIPEDSRWVARAWFGGVELDRQGDIAWVPAGDMLISRSVFDRLGGYDGSLRTNEDCELCDRARAAGFRVLADASVAVVHWGTPQTLAQFYRKDRWHATDGLYVFLRSLPKITNPRPLLFAFYTLACVGGVILGAILAVGSGRWWPLAAFATAWLAPALLLSLRLAVRRQRWRALAPLTVLHLAFGLSRSHALFTAAERLWRTP